MSLADMCTLSRGDRMVSTVTESKLVLDEEILICCGVFNQN
jgi:hypothetical protein